MTKITVMTTIVANKNISNKEVKQPKFIVIGNNCHLYGSPCLLKIQRENILDLLTNCDKVIDDNIQLSCTFINDELKVQIDDDGKFEMRTTLTQDEVEQIFGYTLNTHCKGAGYTYVKLLQKFENGKGYTVYKAQLKK